MNLSILNPVVHVKRFARSDWYKRNVARIRAVIGGASAYLLAGEPEQMFTWSTKRWLFGIAFAVALAMRADSKPPPKAPQTEPDTDRAA